MSGRCLAVVSGKGGVGKTMIASALGAYHAEGGKRTVLIDLNTGMRGLDIAIGLESRVAFDLGDVLEGICDVRQALVTDKRTGVRLLAARQLTGSDRIDMNAFSAAVETLRGLYDRIVIDAPPAMCAGLEAAARVAEDLLLVATPDDAALRGADRAAGLLSRCGAPRPMLAVNRIRAEHVDSGLQYAPEVCAETLDLFLAGAVPEDELAARRILEKLPVAGNIPAAAAIANIALRAEDPDTMLLPWRAEKEAEPPARKSGLFSFLRMKPAIRKETQ